MILHTIVADENEEHLRRNPGIIYWQICQSVAINMCTSYCVFSRVQYFVEQTSHPPHYHKIIPSRAVCNCRHFEDTRRTSSMRPTKKQFLPFRFKTQHNLLRAYSHEKFTKEYKLLVMVANLNV